jgi:hypothetical protein
MVKTLWFTKNHGKNAGMGWNDGFIIGQIGWLNDPKYHRTWMVSWPFFLVDNFPPRAGPGARRAPTSIFWGLTPPWADGLCCPSSMRLEWLTSTKAMSEQWNQGYGLGIYLEVLEEHLLLGLLFGVSGLPLSDIGSRCNKSNETTQQICGRSPFSGKLQKEGVFWGQPILRNRQDCLLWSFKWNPHICWLNSRLCWLHWLHPFFWYQTLCAFAPFVISPSYPWHKTTRLFPAMRMDNWNRKPVDFPNRINLMVDSCRLYCWS